MKLVDLTHKFTARQARSQFKQEVFAPSDAEVAELKKEVERVVKEIIAFEFYGKKCKNIECGYCSSSLL